MTCWTRLGQALALQAHPAGEPAHGLGVLGGLVDGLGEQPDRADRRLELVADVGHEVPADRLDPALPGAVLDQRQHQPGAQRGDPGGDGARRGQLAASGQLGLADLAVAAYLRGPASASSSTSSSWPRTSPRAYAGAEALSTTSCSSTTTALLRSTESTAATPGGSSGSGRGSPASAGAR